MEDQNEFTMAGFIILDHSSFKHSRKRAETGIFRNRLVIQFLNALQNIETQYLPNCLRRPKNLDVRTFYNTEIKPHCHPNFPLSIKEQIDQIHGKYREIETVLSKFKLKNIRYHIIFSDNNGWLDLETKISSIIKYKNGRCLLLFGVCQGIPVIYLVTLHDNASCMTSIEQLVKLSASIENDKISHRSHSTLPMAE